MASVYENMTTDQLDAEIAKLEADEIGRAHV